MWEIWVHSLGWEVPLEKGKDTHSTILAWRMPWTEWGRKEWDTTESLSKRKSKSHKGKGKGYEGTGEMRFVKELNRGL